MSTSRSKRILIIGQGLAGSVLAFRLIRSGHDVTVSDPNLPQTSSRIAAGVIKPVTGQRIVKSWKADVLIPEAVSLYEEIQEVTGTKLIFKRPLFQVYLSNGNRNDWIGRLSQPEIASYCDENRPVTLSSEKWNFRHGGIFLNSCYQLRIKDMIEACSAYIRVKGRIYWENAEKESLEIRAKKVLYKGESFDHMVICTGVDGGTFSTFYDKVPLASVKGEIILVGMDHELKDTMVSGGVYVVPVNEGQALVGATYEWNNSDINPTAAGLDRLRSKLGEIYRSSFTIDAHHAAVRPASPDRKPIAGFLDDKKIIGIMNGFGSKGVMFAPYIAEKMKIALETGQYPDKETDVRRFLP